MTAPDHRLAAAPSPVDAEQDAPIIQAAIRCFRERAFNEVSLETVAQVGGLDLTVVTARFPTINDLVVVTVQAWNGRRTVPLLPIAEQSGAAAFLRAVVVANFADPALMRVLTSVVNIAATPGHPVAHLLQQQWRQFHAYVQRALAHDIAIGREPSTTDPATGAEELIALYEGLQLQSMLRPHMDILTSFDRAVAALRAGWTRVEPQPVWDI